MSKLTKGLSKEEIKQLRKIYWRSNVYAPVFSFDRQCGTGLQWGMYSFFNWLYPKKEEKEKKIEALKRHGVFFNITPYIVTIGMGLFASMEKEAKKNPEFDTNSINAVKAAIQGPLAGIGDAIYWVAWRTIATGIALPFALSGSWLGPLLFFVLFNLPHFVGKYILTFISYKSGTKVIENAFESGIIDMLVRGATIMGLVMIGAMIASLVSVPINVTLNIAGQETTLLGMIDSIMPGLLSLGLSLGVVALLRKKVNVILVTVGLFIVAILGALIGIF